MTEPTQSARIRRIGYSATPTGTPILPVLYDDDMDALPDTDVIDPVLAQGTTAILGYTAGGQGYVKTDFTAPQTTIDTFNMNITGSTSSFVFSSSEPYPTFFGRLDGSTFVQITSPVTYTGLTGGAHLFELYSVDYLGNADISYATGSWTITGSI